MKHQVDHEGNITLSPTPREIDLIAKSIISRNLQLRLDRTSPGSCNELIKLMEDINEAQAQSNKAVLKTKSIEEDEGPAIIRIPESVVSNDSVFEHIDKFLNPSWSTADFEAAKPKAINGKHPLITSMKFADNAPNKPIRVTGLIEDSGHLYKATWDSWGRCQCEDLSKDRWSDYDLVCPGQSKAEASRFMFFSLAGIAVLTIVALIVAYFIEFKL